MYSGDGFSDMHFAVRAVPADAFQAWLASARRSGPSLDQAAYTDLQRQKSPVQPFTYRAIDPHLFSLIATQKIPAGPGPGAGRGGPGVHPTPDG
jgi:cytochrome o ubiquinol oxidase subunit 2